ncbi:MAG: PIN domain-containing protein [Methanosarcina flavescens]|uniref:PIN domain-containing protein n=1 Tax=Methanosarcina flavescens TaxID=1715806 RepID=A0A660HQ11_9EURY|nr:PIN domain-containing protein [Methanosarcina flavescens]AYK14156.1 PIN domain-containing protein [Methanosarcina flavescens]NLK33130.1 PIN domain-containing protein [Methanosarcina flavescens]
MRKSIHRATVYPVKRRPRLRAGASRPAEFLPLKVHSIDEYDFPEGKGYFFDTNIWLYIYGPIGWPDQRSDAYSRALKEIRNSDGTIYINCMIISEFINAFARIEFKQQTNFTRFKEFRNSLAFRAIAQDIAYNVRKILRNTLACDPELQAIDLPKVMDLFEQGKYDFNDLLFAQICRAKNMVFVTHDKDFSELGVEILTANEKLVESGRK